MSALEEERDALQAELNDAETMIDRLRNAVPEVDDARAHAAALHAASLDDIGEVASAVEAFLDQIVREIDALPEDDL